MAAPPPSKKKTEQRTVADVVPLPTARATAPADDASRPFVMLPPSAQARTADLLTPAEQATLAQWPREEPAVKLLSVAAANGLPLALHPTTQVPLLQLLSQHLLADGEEARRVFLQQRASAAAATRRARSRRDSRRVRVSDAEGPIASYATTLPRIVPHGPAELRALREFYAEDAFDEEVPFGGLDPESYPMWEAMERKVHEGDEQRLTAGEHTGEVPREPAPLELTRQFLLRFRMPPLPGERQCRRAMACRFRCIPPLENGYTGRVLELDGAAVAGGLCIDCYLYELAVRVWDENLQQGGSPPLHVNRLTMADGEYSEQALLPRTIEERPTGIVGNVPAYHTSYRAWRRVEDADVIRFGLQPLGAGPHYYLAEINVEAVPAVRPRPAIALLPLQPSH